MEKTTVIHPGLMALMLELGFTESQVETLGKENIGVSTVSDMFLLFRNGFLDGEFLPKTTGCNLVVAARTIDYFARYSISPQEILSALSENGILGSEGEENTRLVIFLGLNPKENLEMIPQEKTGKTTLKVVPLHPSSPKKEE